MKQKTFLTFWSILFGLLLSLSAEAEIFKVWFEARTTTSPGGTTTTSTLDCYITIDSDMKTACADVNAITLYAPDGTVLPVDPVRDWSAFDQYYFLRIAAENFNSGNIPSGNYRVTVRDNGSRTISKSFSLTSNLFPVVTVIAPMPGEIVPNVYRFRWNAVPGAKHYRILLWDDSINEPVYWNYGVGRSVKTDRTYYNLCLGDLIPGHTYRMRIEARDNDLLIRNRSRSSWVVFSVAE